ncbi:MAG: hypothetical protein M3285_14185 [Actinomycetota bacterium]|nr:hypothetical protein [Actinomycetota bacterium]
MQRFKGEVVLSEVPASAPAEASVLVQLHNGSVHVLTWDRHSIYPRQTLVFDRQTPAEVAEWLRALAEAVEGAAGERKAEPALPPPPVASVCPTARASQAC